MALALNAPQITKPSLREVGADANLIDRIARRDQAALRLAYEHYSASVHGVALRILRDPGLAADVTQDVFVRLWERHNRFNPARGSLRAFLQVDARGRSLDLMRSRKAAARRDLADHNAQSSITPAGTEELAERELIGEGVRAALGELPFEQRQPIAMAFFDGLSYREIAATLDIPEGTIKSRIRAGLRQLQTILDVVERA